MGRYRAAGAGIALVFAALATARADYTVTDLGTLGGNSASGLAINASGQAAGMSSVSTSTHNFLSGPNGATPLTDFGITAGAAGNSAFLGINDLGQMATTRYINAFGDQHAVLIGPGTTVVVDLGTLGGTNSFADGVNRSGQVVGTSDIVGGHRHAFVTAPGGGALQDLGTLGGPNSEGHGLNAAGDVVGQADVAAFTGHAFYLSGGRMHDLGTLGGTTSTAAAVNSLGQVAGSYRLADGTSHAFLSDPGGGALHALGALSKGDSAALGVNSLGQVVGSAGIAGPTEPNVSHAFLYSNGTFLDLNTLIPAGLGVTLSSASGINDAGQIIATGTTTPNGPSHAFFLSPVPEPGSLLLLAAGLAAVALGRRRSAVFAERRGGLSR